MTATVRCMARNRGSLTPDQQRRLAQSAEKRENAEADYRAEVLAVMAEGGSFAEVAKVTGLSTNTLQRWKREGTTS